jgi:hypothetical protein
MPVLVRFRYLPSAPLLVEPFTHLKIAFKTCSRKWVHFIRSKPIHYIFFVLGHRDRILVCGHRHVLVNGSKEPIFYYENN